MNTAAPKSATMGDNKPPLITEAQLKSDFQHIADFLDQLETEAADVPTVFEDDDDLAASKAMAPKLRAAIKRIDAVRGETKAPYLQAGNTVQEFFKALEKRADDVLKRLEAAATRYLRKKEDAAREEQRRKEAAEREAAERLAREAVEQAKAGNLDSAVTAQTASQQAIARAEDAGAMAAARPADLARTSTTAGTATLVENYSFTIENITKLDVWTLQPYFTEVEIKAAIARYVKAGGRTLAGVRIFADPKARL